MQTVFHNKTLFSLLNNNMKNKKELLLLFFLSLVLTVRSENIFTHADTLRGMLTPMRTCYDVKFYELKVKIDIDSQSISGSNTIYYKVVSDFDKIQIDLFDNMKLDSIVHDNKLLSYQREANAVFISFGEKQIKDKSDFIKVYYHGTPITAKRPPWDGGFVWKKDKNDKPWVGVACEGIGASLWWPLKDHLSDEPDSMSLIFSIPANNDLTVVANGRLRKTDISKKTNEKTFEWFVSKPINSYNVTINIADYAHLSDKYGENELDYYVLSYNVDKAKTHFEKEVKNMLNCFEKYFGKYPFWNDSYKLVETNYWGMEHQSCIAYGNKYKTDLWGFDFIIVHESAHEWWGNHVSCSDIAETWIHESFATYAEALYVEYYQGKEESQKYLDGQKSLIVNKGPVVGPLQVNYDNWIGSNDMYYKGSWMLHTLRNILNDDSLWFKIISGIQHDFALQVITTKQITDYIIEKSGRDLNYFFEQYLKNPLPPRFIYQLKSDGNNLTLYYKWEAETEGFKMPIKVTTAKYDFTFIYPTQEWKMMKLKNISPEDFKIAEDLFYVKLEMQNDN